MATQFEELSLNNIDQGVFVTAAEDQFRKLQDDLIRHVREHGSDEAIATLVLKVELKHKLGAVFVTTAIEKRPPAVPKMVTNALMDSTQSDDEVLVLFTAVGGSNSDTPRQQQLCTRKGDPINQSRENSE